MATVDFTLEDIRSLMVAELSKERVSTRQIVREEVSKEVAKTVGRAERNIINQMNSFIENNFNPAIESLQSQINEMKDIQSVVNRHSLDIMELRARQA